MSSPFCFVCDIFPLNPDNSKGFLHHKVDKFTPWLLATITSICWYSSSEIKPLFSRPNATAMEDLYARISSVIAPPSSVKPRNRSGSNIAGPGDHKQKRYDHSVYSDAHERYAFLHYPCEHSTRSAYTDPNKTAVSFSPL